jgi:ATP-dependent RNA helicase DeaD
MSEVLESFDEFREDVRAGIRALGWSKPMPVQQRVIPPMRAGRDLIVQAVTGSGKTGAFGLPIVERVQPGLRAVQAMVLAPTRELAIQVGSEIATMGRPAGVDTTSIYGGVAYGPQLAALERGTHVIVGTPGRILDHLNARRMDVSHLRVLIFDEADELLSLGFWPDMREIQRFLPKQRQSGLFSATIPERVRSLARSFLVDPEFISLVDDRKRSPDEIEHYHYLVTASEKDKTLLRILEYEEPESAIIFCNTRDDVRYVSALLQRNGFDADMIQGEMTQAAREQVMARIKAGNLRFLVATDVAARGIDISDLSHVIGYSTPDSAEVYLHRTGRTGRAGKTGIAISLVSGLDIGNFQNVQNVNRMKIPARDVPTDADVAARLAQRLQVAAEHELRELGERERAQRQAKMVPVIERLVASEEGREALAVHLYKALHATVAAAPAGVGGETRAEEPAARGREPAAEPAAEPSGRTEGDGPRKRRRRRGRRGSDGGGPGRS